MPRARKHLVCVADTPYYHVTSRCVRRAFLCGVDSVSGTSYEHRRDWIETRIRLLSSLFSIRICAYAVMSNHYHLVVKLRPRLVDHWSVDEVLNRWTTLFKGPLLVQRYVSGEAMSAAELDTLQSIVEVYRQRLGSLSWFMRCLNEPIARQANAEDGCSGHFWEARFHSQALMSETALFTAMAYADLNPIRANIARTPETSDYTSIKARIEENADRTVSRRLASAVKEMLETDAVEPVDVPIQPLMRFSPVTTNTAADDDLLPMAEYEYFKLVDHTARVLVHDKRGRMDPEMAPILERLGLSVDQWIGASSDFRKHYRNGDLRLTRSA